MPQAVRDIERIQLAEQQNATIAIPAIEKPTAIPEDYLQYRLMIDMQVVAWRPT
jgi:hypothetical protein